MIVHFTDLQDPNNPQNGVKIGGSDQLLRILDTLSSRTPFYAELEGENGFKLLIGIGAEVGCAQYSSTNGEPPYLMAISPNEVLGTGYVDFLIGDTASPVPIKYCISFPTLQEVVGHFIEAGERWPGIEWEEIGPT